MTAQQTVETAIAVAEMTAAERAFRTEVELIIAAAMIRAVRPAGEILDAAMIAELPGQVLRSLPIDANNGACRRGIHRPRRAGRGEHETSQSQTNRSYRCQEFHYASIIAVESRDGEMCCGPAPAAAASGPQSGSPRLPGSRHRRCRHAVRPPF